MPKKKIKRSVPVKALRTTSKIHGKGRMTSPTAVIQLERRYKVIELRRQGCDLHEIAGILGTDVNTIREDLKVVLSRTAQGLLESTEEWRELEVERLRSLIKFYQPLAEKGNMAAAGLVMQISRDLRKMMALDKPEEKKIDETGVRLYVGINVDEV